MWEADGGMGRKVGMGVERGTGCEADCFLFYCNATDKGTMQLQLLRLINLLLPYRTLISSEYGAKLCKIIIPTAATTVIMITTCSYFYSAVSHLKVFLVDTRRSTRAISRVYKTLIK